MTYAFLMVDEPKTRAYRNYYVNIEKRVIRLMKRAEAVRAGKNYALRDPVSARSVSRVRGKASAIQTRVVTKARG
jgi:ribulose 1,5-bisphosphate carboxylase large subunit-like protein